MKDKCWEIAKARTTVSSREACSVEQKERKMVKY